MGKAQTIRTYYARITNVILGEKRKVKREKEEEKKLRIGLEKENNRIRSNEFNTFVISS
jgi:hypothetical protein